MLKPSRGHIYVRMLKVLLETDFSKEWVSSSALLLLEAPCEKPAIAGSLRNPPSSRIMLLAVEEGCFQKLAGSVVHQEWGRRGAYGCIPAIGRLAALYSQTHSSGSKCSAKAAMRHALGQLTPSPAGNVDSVVLCPKLEGTIYTGLRGRRGAYGEHPCTMSTGSAAVQYTAVQTHSISGSLVSECRMHDSVSFCSLPLTAAAQQWLRWCAAQQWMILTGCRFQKARGGVPGGADHHRLAAHTKIESTDCRELEAVPHPDEGRLA
jgi:hypothetical protein